MKVGLDLEDLERWRQKEDALRPGGDLERLFFPAEHRYCRSYADPMPHYAGRWCAKEAVVKALDGVLPISVRKVEILDAEGAPTVRLHVPDGESAAGELALSITHTDRTVGAVAVYAGTAML